MVKLVDIAAAAHVSKAAVSYAFSSDPAKRGKLSAATLERILQTAADLDYTPSWTARALARQRSYNIALLLPEECTRNMSGHYLGLFHGVSSAMADSEYNLSVFFGCDRKFMQNVQHNRIDGLVVIARRHQSAVFSMLGQLEHPMVFLNRTAPGECGNAGSCRSDYRRWLEEILLEFKARQIKQCTLFYREERNSDQEIRQLFAGLCSDLGLKSSELKRENFGSFDVNSADSAMVCCGSSPEIIDVLSRAKNDNYVMLSTPATNRRGLLIQQNLYYHDSKNIGRAGVNMLLKMIDAHAAPEDLTIPLVQIREAGGSGNLTFEF